MSCSEELKTFDEGMLRIGGTEYCVTRFEHEGSADIKDVSCTGPKGKKKKRRSTQIGANVRIEAHYNPSENLMAAPADVYEGASLEDVEFFPDREDLTRKFRYDCLVVEKNRFAGQVGDEYKIDIDCQTDGDYSLPGRDSIP